MLTETAASEVKLYAGGAAAGLIYGLVMRLGVRLFHGSHLFVVMSIGFVFLVPLAMGFISIYWIERLEPQESRFGCFCRGS